MDLSRQKSAAKTGILIFDGSSVDIFIDQLKNHQRAVSRAAQKMSWIVVCDGCSTDLLAQAAARLRVDLVQAGEPGQGLGDWPALCVGARYAPEGWLLLLPSGPVYDASLLKKMFALTPDHAWVMLSDPQVPLWQHVAFETITGLPPADLTAPCLVRRTAFLDLVSQYSLRASFFGARVLVKARRLKSGVARLATEIKIDQRRSTSLLSTQLGLNVNRLRKEVIQNTESLFVAVGLLVVGLMTYVRMPVIGLTCLGLGCLALASLLGKAE